MRITFNWNNVAVIFIGIGYACNKEQEYSLLIERKRFPNVRIL